MSGTTARRCGLKAHERLESELSAAITRGKRLLGVLLVCVEALDKAGDALAGRGNTNEALGRVAVVLGSLNARLSDGDIRVLTAIDSEQRTLASAAHVAQKAIEERDALRDLLAEIAGRLENDDVTYAQGCLMAKRIRAALEKANG